MDNLPVLQSPLADPNQEIDLRRYWTMIARSAWIIVVCVGLAVAAAVAAVRKIQPMYDATATVRIEDHQGKGGAGAAAMYYFGGTDYQTQIAVAAEVITSRSLAALVVDDLGLRIGVEQPQRNALVRSATLAEAHTTPDAPDSAYRLVKAGSSREVHVLPSDSLLGTYPNGGPLPIIGGTVRLTREAQDLDRIVIRLIRRIDAAEALRAQIEVSPRNKDANVLAITYRGADTALVRQIPNTVARRFVGRKAELDRSGAAGQVDFLQKQFGALSGDMAEAEDSIRLYLEGQKIASVDQTEALLGNELGQLRSSRREIDESRVAIQRALEPPQVAGDSIVRAEAWLKQLQSTRAFVASGVAGGEVSRLEALLAQRRDLLTTLLPGSDRVASVDEQIAGTQRVVRERATQYLANLETDLRNNQHRIDSVTAQLQKVPEQALRYSKLQRNRKIIEEQMTLVQARLKEAEIAAAVTDSTASLLDDAVAPSQQVGSSETLIFVVAVISGLIVGVTVAFLRDWLDTTIRSEKDLASVVGVAVVGIIPNLQQQSRSSGYRLPAPQEGGDPKPRPTTGREYQTPAAEAYRTLRTNLNYLTPPRAPHVIVITSALPGDGKTTTTVNLAVTLAHQGQRVILIDAETRRGTVHEVFGIPPAPGFFDLMYGQASPGECIRRVQMEGGGTIDILPLGSAPSVNPADLLVAARLQPLFERLRGQYDYVLLDTPPLNLFTDAALIGAHADALLLVARADKTDRDELRFAVQQLRNVQVTLAGTILNDVEFRRSSRYRLGYGYYYDYAR